MIDISKIKTGTRVRVDGALVQLRDSA